MTNFDVALVDLYRQRGVASAADPPGSVHLPTECPKSKSCWADLDPEHVPATGSPPSELSAPWIGPHYGDGRIAIVMENLRDYGGFDLGADATKGMRLLGRLAREQLAAGRRRLFRNPVYRGTDVWPRALAYAATWLDPANVSPTANSLVAALDRVAVVQHVKCSPKSRGSDQSAAMWAECGSHILAGELAILQPSRVIVLGTGDNARALRANVLRSPHRERGSKTIAVGRRRLTVSLTSTETAWGSVDVLIAPHPAGRGGNSRSLSAAVRELLLS